jgi:hypothetical protein
MKELYKSFKYNGKLVDIKNFNPDIMGILSRKVHKMITDGEKGWEDMLPQGISEMIKKQRLFGYSSRRFNKKR